MMNIEPTRPFVAAVSAALDDLPDATLDQIATHARSYLQNEPEKEEVIFLALRGIAQKVVRIRSIEKFNDQGDLFCDDLMKKRVSYERASGESAYIEYGKMTYNHHTDYRERQILNLRKTNRAFEREEQRRKLLFKIMQNSPDVTTEVALIKLQQPVEA